MGLSESTGFMVHKLSGAAQEKLTVLEEVRRKWDRVHRLVEESSVQRSGHDVYWQRIRRSAKEIGRTLSNAGLRNLANVIDEIEVVVRRPMSVHAKTQGLRDVVSTVRDALEGAAEDVIAADQKRQARSRRFQPKPEPDDPA